MYYSKWVGSICIQYMIHIISWRDPTCLQNMNHIHRYQVPQQTTISQNSHKVKPATLGTSSSKQGTSYFRLPTYMMYSAGPGVGIAKVGTAAEVVWIPNLVQVYKQDRNLWSDDESLRSIHFFVERFIIIHRYIHLCLGRLLHNYYSVDNK